MNHESQTSSKPSKPSDIPKLIKHQVHTVQTNHIEEYKVEDHGQTSPIQKVKYVSLPVSGPISCNHIQSDSPYSINIHIHAHTSKLCTDCTPYCRTNHSQSLPQTIIARDPSPYLEKAYNPGLFTPVKTPWRDRTVFPKFIQIQDCNGNCNCNSKCAVPGEPALGIYSTRTVDAPRCTKYIRGMKGYVRYRIVSYLIESGSLARSWCCDKCNTGAYGLRVFVIIIQSKQYGELYYYYILLYTTIYYYLNSIYLLFSISPILSYSPSGFSFESVNKIRRALLLLP